MSLLTSYSDKLEQTCNSVTLGGRLLSDSLFSHRRSHLTEILYFLYNFKREEFDGKNILKCLRYFIYESCVEVIKINSTHLEATQKAALAILSSLF